MPQHKLGHLSFSHPGSRSSKHSQNHSQRHPMTTINFGTTFVERAALAVTRTTGFEPDWIFNQTQRLDNLCIYIESAEGAQSDHRPSIYICPCLRTTNPTDLLFLQRFSVRGFPGQRVTLTRASMNLASLDPSGGVNRRDLIPAIWILKPFTEAFIRFYTF